MGWGIRYYGHRLWAINSMIYHGHRLVGWDIWYLMRSSSCPTSTGRDLKSGLEVSSRYKPPQDKESKHGQDAHRAKSEFYGIHLSRNIKTITAQS